VNRLPVLISIPHGGNVIPSELKELVILTKSELFDDSDAYTREIYDLGDKVVEVITTDIARAIIDVSRSPYDLPPTNPDGVVKTKTCFGCQVYRHGYGLNKQLTEEMLSRYYFPYHKKIRRAVQRKEIILALDCHSMASIGPQISPNPGKKRPMICLGNVRGRSCNMDLVEKLSVCFQQAFSADKDDITINEPFAGGFITRKYGMSPLPWIQVELNRNLYLSPPWFNRQTLYVNKKRLTDLKSRFNKTLTLFFTDRIE